MALDLRWTVECDLPAELERLLRQIPRGRLTTYGVLARVLGDVRAARWAGEYLVRHDHQGDCPCHRVVRTNGDLGNYVEGQDAKRVRLAGEGVVLQNGRADVGNVFTEFVCDAPLSRMQDIQRAVPGELTLRPPQRDIKLVAGIDVAYPQPGMAVGAAVVVDAATLETVHAVSVRALARFPYIPGYLTFRELPAMLRAWEAIIVDGAEPDVVLIDGNGYLHPRRAGIACCFGLAVGVPTIGVSKKLLCGQVDVAGLRAGETRPILHNDELIGMAVKSRDTSRPVFVSPGNLMDVPTAAEIVQRLMDKHRLPEPLQRADRLSKTDMRCEFVEPDNSR